MWCILLGQEMVLLCQLFAVERVRSGVEFLFGLTCLHSRIQYKMQICPFCNFSLPIENYLIYLRIHSRLFFHLYSAMSRLLYMSYFTFLVGGLHLFIQYDTGVLAKEHYPAVCLSVLVC